VTDSLQPQPFAQPFDERSALEELEQLADKIQLSRRQREQKVAEFDAFVRTFRQDHYAAAIAATERERRAEDRPAAVSAATHAARGVVPVTQAGASPGIGSVSAPASVPESTPWGMAVPREPVAHVVKDRPGRPRAAYVGVALAALAVLVVGVLLWRSAGAPVGPAPPSDSSAVSAASTPQAPPRAVSPVAATPAPAPPVPAGPPRALNIEFVTVRPVWARITVDGRRAMEREFKADQRIPFGADRAIVIRAGDAGAIRLVVDGKDLGVLGRDGQVFERSFAVAAR
jgi:Domain of unknown function (DUF4115)